jgi:hypothetical protein
LMTRFGSTINAVRFRTEFAVDWFLLGVTCFRTWCRRSNWLLPNRRAREGRPASKVAAPSTANRLQCAGEKLFRRRW